MVGCILADLGAEVLKVEHPKGELSRSFRPQLPNSKLNVPHETVVRILTEGLVDLGRLAGHVDDLIEEQSYQRFFMHRTGHWLGLDVHDCGYYAVEGSSRLLEPGMALTVEPGLYVDPENDQVDAKWRGIGVRIEDDLLVTESGHENLTAAIPKEVDEVEAACAGVDLATTRA